MSSNHDGNFKALMEERGFFEPFLKTYLPSELLKKIDWPSIDFYKMGGTHREEKTQQEFESDVIYLAKLDGQESFLWIHTEHQAIPDKTMALRVLNYQTAELLAYSKGNPNKELPAIVTFIYHQGEKRWPHSVNIADMFIDPSMAMKYLGAPILIDLPATSDEELKKHQNIAPIELILKHVRQKDFEKNMRMDLLALRTVDDKARRIVLKYLLKVADVSDKLLLETAKECLPQDKELLMTVEDRILQRGVEEGIEKVAVSMLRAGFDEKAICNITGLPLETLTKIKNTISK